MPRAEVNLFQWDTIAEVPSRKQLLRIKKKKDPEELRLIGPQEEMSLERELGHQSYGAF